MSLAIVHTRARLGLDAPAVSVEVHISNGLPGLAIVGLPATAVRESKDRVRSAILNSRFEFPQRRITINLAPADLPKDGGRFDLPIALGILAASGQLPKEVLAGHEFLGELALTGELRPVTGVLPASLAARAAGRALVVAAANAGDAARPQGAEVYAADHLLTVCGHLLKQSHLPLATPPPASAPSALLPDLADVRGQLSARRALEVAAAGGHSLLMIGPPGTGKTMLASRLPSILPPLAEAEALEVAAIRSLASQGHLASGEQRPFRAPHHTASAVALVGGGSQPRPGEITLAHRGVLFLDELPEYDRRVLEVLREPLESGEVMISRAAQQLTFPAAFQLVAAMNPCPCGHQGDGTERCRCTPDQIARYRQRLSGPLLDRIDLHVEVAAVGSVELARAQPGETSASVRGRVLAARQRQLVRQGKTNHLLLPGELGQWAALSPPDTALLEKAMVKLRLSARAYHRILKVARTIADLAGAEPIGTAHLTEALSYRCLDRGLV